MNRIVLQREMEGDGVPVITLLSSLSSLPFYESCNARLGDGPVVSSSPDLLFIIRT